MSTERPMRAISIVRIVALRARYSPLRCRIQTPMMVRAAATPSETVSGRPE